MDILGICILAVGAGTSATYYACYCDAITRFNYWALNLGAGAAAAATLFDTGGGGSKIRALRGGVFSILAISAMLPILQRSYSLGWRQSYHEVGSQWYLAEALSLLTGVGLFVASIPERLRPGSFDIWGHSHQLFHLFALAGAAFHLVALITGYKYRQAHLIVDLLQFRSRLEGGRLA